MSKLKEAAMSYYMALPSTEDDVNERSLMDAFQEGSRWLLAEAEKLDDSMEEYDVKWDGNGNIIETKTIDVPVIKLTDLKKLIED